MMRLTRLSIAVACTALFAVSAQADAKTAKPKPVPASSCRALVTDPAGDANGVNLGAPAPATHAGPSADPLDILGIDLATGKTAMTWLLRVEKLAVTSLDAPTGMLWSVHFKIRKTTFTVAAHSSPVSGLSYDLSYASVSSSGRLGPIAGALDTAHNELRFVVPISTIAKQERAPMRAKITDIDGDTAEEIVAAPLAIRNAADWTTSKGTYTPGKSRCA